MSANEITTLVERLDRIEAALAILVGRQAVKEWYTTAEVAKTIDKAEYTVREWCRLGRIAARKKPCGRGRGGEWLVSHDELTRLRNEGLLPFRGTGGNADPPFGGLARQ
jgi:hypothetical protein